jgi:hypothetical protein
MCFNCTGGLIALRVIRSISYPPHVSLLHCHSNEALLTISLFCTVTETKHCSLPPSSALSLKQSTVHYFLILHCHWRKNCSLSPSSAQSLKQNTAHYFLLLHCRWNKALFTTSLFCTVTETKHCSLPPFSAQSLKQNTVHYLLLLHCRWNKTLFTTSLFWSHWNKHCSLPQWIAKQMNASFRLRIAAVLWRPIKEMIRNGGSFISRHIKEEKCGILKR